MASTALVTPTEKLPAHLQGLGAIGNENVSADTLATPRLYLLQALSDQVVKGNPNYVKGASSGMYLNSVSNELYEELFVSNLYMTRGFNVNKKRIFGQKDWKGFHPTQESALERLERDGVNPADYDITDTHVHTLALVNPETGKLLTPIQFDMRNSALRESRQWNSNIVARGPDIPRFAGIWKLTAKLNTNNKGSWYTPEVTFAGWASDELFKELHDLYKGMRAAAPAVGHDDAPF